jgi:hypothetical protein
VIRAPALALIVVAGAAAGAAQAQPGPRPGPWVIPGSRLDGLIGWVIADGSLPGLDPLTRPYRLAAVRRAVESADTSGLSSSGRTALTRLRDALSLMTESTIVVAEIGAAAYRNGRRDQFRPDGGRGAGAQGGILAGLTRGPLVALVNPAFERRLRDDPEFTGFRERALVGRLQTGYAALTGESGDLFLGRIPRDWGPGMFGGLQLSPSAYATDQLAGTLRAGRLELTTIAQRLDDANDSAGTPLNRWFLAHRLGIDAGRGVRLAFTETGVYGGPGRGFEPAMHMPLAPALLAQYNEDREVNLLWGAEVHIPLRRGLNVQLQGVIDDLQIDNKSVTDRRPWSGGFTATVTAALPWHPVHVSAGYTQVRSLTYRNSVAPLAMYAVDSVGIGRNFADYDQWLGRLEARLLPELEVTAMVTRIRQGSGDFRAPFPEDSLLALPGQGFLVAPTARMWGIMVSAGWEPGEGVWIRGSAGTIGRPSGGRQPVASLSIGIALDAITGRLASTWQAVERSH